MAKQRTDTARGILHPNLGQQKFDLARYHPSDILAPYVEHYWTVRWDLRDQPPYHSATLPHPSIHLTVEQDTANVVGVVTQKFTRILHDMGWVFGIKFNPGAFYAFHPHPIAELTDQNIPLADLFGEQGHAYAHDLRTATTDAERIARAEAFLTALVPTPDTRITLIADMVATIMHDRTITKVDDLVARYQQSKRTLQRLFHTRVGVSPKWVIQRYRLHEAIEQAAAGVAIDWSQLAVELGYFDQAHLIKDFKALVGMPPAEYARQVTTPPA